jgi:uncharacterized protein
MPDTVAQTLALPGFGWLIFAAFLAGVVRGFSGFGTAMIFLPFAAQVLPPVWAILALIGMDILGPIPVLRRAARSASGRELGLLVGFGAVCVPLGVWLLTVISAETYRYVISAIALALVGCLLAGLRYRGRPSPALVGATGAVAGLSGGLSGIPGPPVILLYMASSMPVAQVRANTMIFLFCFDFILLGVIWLSGQGVWFPFLAGILLAVPNALGNLAGQAIFDPDRAKVYRGVAYAIVAASALKGLPIWE